MPRSMTGYGRAEIAESGWTAAWEVKSVNGRFLDVKWRTPPALRGLEGRWEKIVRKHAARGRVDAYLHLEVTEPGLMAPTLNAALARGMLEQVGQLAASMQRSFEPDFNRFMSMSFLWQDPHAETDPTLAASLDTCLENALMAWNTTRKREGEALAVEIA